MNAQVGLSRNRIHIIIIIALAAIAILAVVLITSVRNVAPHEIDAPYGPKPFDLKTLKTNIAPISEETAVPTADDDMEMDY